MECHPKVLLGARHARDPERGHAARVRAPVTGRHAVEHRRAAGDERLEAGDPSGRVDDHVGRGDQVAHAPGEPEHAHASVAREARLEPLANLVVAARDADDASRAGGARAANRPLEVAYPPPSTGHEHEPPTLGQPERAPRLEPRAALEEGGCYERTHARGAPWAGELVDAGGRAVHHEVEVDPPVGPELEARQVEDGGADASGQPAPLAQAPEDRVDTGVGRYDDVGGVRLDQAKQAATADAIEHRVRPPPNRPEPHEQGVDDAEEPRDAAKLKPRAVPDHPTQERAERGQPILDRHLGTRAPGGEVGGERAGGRLVPLPQIGGQHEDPPRRKHGGLGFGLSDRRCERCGATRTPPARWRAPPRGNLPPQADAASCAS